MWVISSSHFPKLLGGPSVWPPGLMFDTFPDTYLSCCYDKPIASFPRYCLFYCQIQILKWLTGVSPPGHSSCSPWRTVSMCWSLRLFGASKILPSSLETNRGSSKSSAQNWWDGTSVPTQSCSNVLGFCYQTQEPTTSVFFCVSVNNVWSLSSYC